MAGIYPKKRIRGQLYCEICPEYGTLPLITTCSECKQNLCVSCPHDKCYDSRCICQPCSQKLSTQSTFCTTHDNSMTYYCLTCERGVCVDCLLQSNNHNQHNFEHLDKLYEKRLEHVTKKLNELTEALECHEENYKRVSKNLQMLKANELELMDEIDALAKSAKADIQRSVHTRKENLMDKLKQPTGRNFHRRDWESKINQMTKTEFIRTYAQTLEEISKQMATTIGTPHELVECYNIKCALIPKIVMQPLFIENIANKQGPVSLLLFDASGFAWSLRAFLENKFGLQFTPKNKRQEIYKHKAVVEILHDDFTKTLKHSFIIPRYDEKIEFSDMIFLKENGYISKDGHDMLMIRVAIKPISIVVENFLHIDENNNLRYGVNEEIKDLKKLVDQMKHRSCSNLFLSPKSLINKGDCCLSHSLVDSRGGEWCLRVKLNVRKRKEQDMSWLGVYVIKLSGPRSKCKFYVKLYNQDPEKHVKMECEEMRRLEAQTYGHHSFVDVDLLTEENGFLNDGVVRFEFGITPINSSSTDEGEPSTVPNNGTSEDFLRCRHLFGTFG